MVVLNSTDMYECRVLYIGSAPPIETLKGTEALQEPLNQRYPSNLDDVEGIDANVRVLPTALEITYVASGQQLLFPLERLAICAAVRAVIMTDGTTGEQTRRFVPVNELSPEHGRHPAIFSAIIRRSQGRQIAECHAFICNSTRDALHLVNATASANMHLKQRKGNYTTTTNGNDDVIIQAQVVNGYAENGAHEHTTNTDRDWDRVDREVYIKTVGDMDNTHYQIEQSQVQSEPPETIYITFDKSNLRPKGDDTLEVVSTPAPHATATEYAERRYFAPPTPAPRTIVVPRPMYAQPRYTTKRPVAPPMQPAPARFVYSRPLPQPPPQPVFMRPPPRPMYIRPPPPQPMYARRFMTPQPIPMRYVAPAPMYMRTRARSASPMRYASSDIRANKGRYQPKWEGRPNSENGLRMSRRDMFLNEKAFSRRMHADNRISRSTAAYHYPTAYDLHDAMLYDRPTTKSNPRYSSSDSSSDKGDRRRSPRRSTRR
ncbi:protocadherin-15-like [Mya arenaria]|uniref:protocadherin-15-like n=1 Tax=Mya arenaria TaxID=6604 RepID=UPI0022E57800|nr:protocadherin-15-like [Mya arenaria]